MPDSPYAVLWDVDGTLVDTAELHYQAWVALAAEIGQPYTRQNFADTFGWRNPEIIPLLFGAHLPPEEVDRLGTRKEDMYRTEARKGVDLLPGVRNLLDALHQAGVAQAIGSSAPRANVDMLVRMTGTARFFRGIISMEDTERGKPHPEVFLKAARLLGASPDRCVVMEDAPVGVQAAKAAGMKAIGITFVGHHAAETLQVAGADRVVRSLEEIDVTAIREMLLPV